jgi:hypothetical protein
MCGIAPRFDILAHIGYVPQRVASLTPPTDEGPMKEGGCHGRLHVSQPS